LLALERVRLERVQAAKDLLDLVDLSSLEVGERVGVFENIAQSHV